MGEVRRIGCQLPRASRARQRIGFAGRPAASSTSSRLLRSKNGIKKLTPKGPAWACSSSAMRSTKGIGLACSSMHAQTTSSTDRDG
jgi:hypothetical protein